MNTVARRMLEVAAILVLTVLAVMALPSSAEASPNDYVVKANDTSWGIAAKNGITVTQLKNANPGLSPALIYPGDALVIPGGANNQRNAGNTSQPERQPAPAQKTRQVNYPGETEHTTYGQCVTYADRVVDVPWLGDANQWDDYARSYGWGVNTAPAVGAIGQTDAGQYGHVAIVEAVSSNGQYIKYSDMNGLAGLGNVGYSGWVHKSHFPVYIHQPSSPQPEQAQATRQVESNQQNQQQTDAVQVDYELASTSTEQPSASANNTAATDSIESIIREAATANGVDPDWLVALADCESTLNPNVTNYGYYDNGYPTGLFQHISGYWPDRAAAYGYAGASIKDPVAQSYVTAGMIADGKSYMWECTHKI